MQPTATIRTSALFSRRRDLAVAIGVVLDGADIAADGQILKGAVLFKKVNGKYRLYVHGTDTLVAGGVAIVQTELDVKAGQDAFADVCVEGFFYVADLIAATPNLVLADLTSASGFVPYLAGTEVRLR